MERSFSTKQVDALAEFRTAYELERQLESAEHRFLEAVEARHSAREEWRELSQRPGASAEAVAAAKARFDAFALRASRLRNLIEAIELKIDV